MTVAWPHKWEPDVPPVLRKVSGLNQTKRDRHLTRGDSFEIGAPLGTITCDDDATSFPCLDVAENQRVRRHGDATGPSTHHGGDMSALIPTPRRMAMTVA